MTDVFDRASIVEQENFERAMLAQKAKAAASPKMRPTGYCQNPKCWTEFDDGSPQLFCDGACSMEYQRLTKTK